MMAAAPGVSYDNFLATKQASVPQSGIDVECGGYDMMPHQRDLTRFALRRGRAAIFADTGLGFVAIQMQRRFIGIELKQSYYQQAARNLQSAHKESGDLFGGSEVAA